MTKFTLANLQQVADGEGCTVWAVITLLQSHAAEIGDVETLDALCEVKAEMLGL